MDAEPPPAEPLPPLPADTIDALSEMDDQSLAAGPNPPLTTIGVILGIKVKATATPQVPQPHYHH